MTPEPTDKLDAAAMAAVNGPADDTLPNERIVGRHVTGPARACLSRMRGNVARPVLGGPGPSNGSGLPNWRSHPHSHACASTGSVLNAAATSRLSSSTSRPKSSSSISARKAQANVASHTGAAPGKSRVTAGLAPWKGSGPSRPKVISGEPAANTRANFPHAAGIENGDQPLTFSRCSTVTEIAVCSTFEAGATGLEPATSGVTERRSSVLNANR